MWDARWVEAVGWALLVVLLEAAGAAVLLLWCFREAWLDTLGAVWTPLRAAVGRHLHGCKVSGIGMCK